MEWTFSVGLCLLIIQIGCFICNANGVPVTSVPLYNAAVPGTRMPVMGLGTGSYGAPGEHWTDNTTHVWALNFLKQGGRRIDGALTYGDQIGVGKAVIESGIPREEIFITSKIPLMGFNETLANFEQALSDLNMTYVDLLLIHEPCQGRVSSDPACPKGQNISCKLCRQSVWRALEVIFKSGRAKAIGVSNFVARHIQDLLELPDSLVPSVNQCEYQPYAHDDSLVQFCQSHNITFNSYAPLCTPDWGPIRHHWPLKRGCLDETIVHGIVEKHGKTPAQVVLRWAWQKNIVLNPRSMNSTHIGEILDIFDFELSPTEMTQIDNMTPPPHPRVCGDPYQCK